MKSRFLLTRAVLVAAELFVSLAVFAQLPPQAQIYLDTKARLRGQQTPMRIVFYQARGESVGVVIFDSNGRQIVRAKEDLTLGLYEGTGVYDVTGDGWPEVVLIGAAGAKTLAAVVYEFRAGGLHEIFRASGYSVKVVRLGGQPVIATNGQYGTLSDLYVWRNGKFERANEMFPEFYGPEIEQQRRVIESPKGFPLYVVAQACELAARALVYARNYEKARSLCSKGLQVAQSSPEVIPSRIGASAEVLAEERKEAELGIQKTLDRITKAEEGRLSRLPP